jgi:hypothetical protein
MSSCGAVLVIFLFVQLYREATPNRRALSTIWIFHTTCFAYCFHPAGIVTVSAALHLAAVMTSAILIREIE